MIHILWPYFTLFMVCVATGVAGAYLLQLIGMLLGIRSCYDIDPAYIHFDGTIYGLGLFFISIFVHIGLKLLAK